MGHIEYSQTRPWIQKLKRINGSKEACNMKSYMRWTITWTIREELAMQVEVMEAT